MFIISISIILGVLSSIKTLVITIDGNKQIFRTFSSDMYKTAVKSGITWNWYDKVSTYNDGQNYNIEIKRSFPVNLQFSGKDHIIFMTNGTVKDALLQYGIETTATDIVNLSMDEPLYPNIVIALTKIEINEYEVLEDIPFNTRKEEIVLLSGNENIPKNIEGEVGIKKIVKRDTIVDGVLTASVTISDEVVKNPVNAVTYSTIVPESIKVDGKSVLYKKKITMIATAYSGDTASGGPRAANGEWLSHGSAAINREFCTELKMGDKLYVETSDGKMKYGFAKINDYGRGNYSPLWIDLYIPSEAQCLAWGRRSVTVYVLY